MNVSFEEIGRLAVTFAQSGCVSGQVCKLDADGKAVPCGDGEKFCGVAEVIRGDFAGVQVAGFATVQYSGSAPDVGYVNLCADASGGVKTGSGREYLVVSVNETVKTAVIKL